MPEMTAKELCELLEKHPKACKALGIRVELYDEDFEDFEIHSGYINVINGADDHEDNASFRRWLLGRCTEFCDEQQREVVQDRDCPSKFLRTTSQFGYDVYPSRLHAALAAIEEGA